MVPTGEKVPPCFKIVKAGRIFVIAVAACLLGLVGLCAGGSSIASAASFGQIGEAWGEKGEGPGQFREPMLFGVDPVDGSVYTGDISAGGTPLSYRLQKFSSAGSFEAGAEIPRWDDPEHKKLRTLYGIAVDHERGLVYLLQGCRAPVGSFTCSIASGKLNAERIFVFKAAPEGGKLVPAATPSLPLPEGADQLYSPQGIAVDPSNHDILVLAEDSSARRVVQRFGSTGTPGPRFVDTAGTFVQHTVFAVGPAGTTYLVTGSEFAAGAGLQRAWELPPDLSTAQQVPGFAAAVEREKWGTSLSVLGALATGGPEISISGDGDTLYWKETDGSELLLVRAFSLAKGETSAVYGGGTSRCRIATKAALLGATRDDLLVFDAGQAVNKPPYKVITFGPGGTGCPVPVAKFMINGSEADGTVVGKGEAVTFDASPSELGDGERRELIWDFGDGQKQTVKCTEDPGGGCEQQVPPTVTHEYASGGEFTVRLEIKLITPIFGNPPPVTHTLKVPQPVELSVFKSGSGGGTVTSAPSGISCGFVCAASFETGTTVALMPSADAGSEFAGWSGACSGTGACSVALSESKSVTARFESEGPPPSKFDLSVLTTGSGSGSVSSSPLGIACGAACSTEFAAGTTVALMPSADAGSEFAGWSGACSGAGACQVTMDEAKTVGAAFEVGSGNAMLTVSWAGSGAGRVKSDQSGINCGPVCSGEFRLGQTVTLFPVAAPGSEFERWGGDCAAAGTALTCKLQMSDNRSAQAIFSAIPPAPAPSPSPFSSITAGVGGGAAPSGGKKPSAKQKALARCRRKKGRARHRCLRSTRGSGKQPKHRKGAGGRGRGGTR